MSKVNKRVSKKVNKDGHKYYDTYPNQSECTTRSTSSLRRRRRPTEHEDTDLPLEARRSLP